MSEPLEAEFHEVLSSLSSDPSLLRFRSVLEKIHGEWTRGREVQSLLQGKVKELDATISSNASRVAEAIRMSDEDTNTIDELRRHVERARADADAALKREAQAASALESLSHDNAALKAALAKTAALMAEQQASSVAPSAPAGSSAASATAASSSSSAGDLSARLEVALARAAQAESVAAAERERADEAVADLKSRSEKYKAKKVAHAELERIVAVKAAEEASLTRRAAETQKMLTETRSAFEASKKSLLAAQTLTDEAEAKAAEAEKQVAAARSQHAATHREKKDVERVAERAALDLEEANAKLGEMRTEREGAARELRRVSEELGRERAAVGKLKARLEAEARESERLAAIINTERVASERLRAELASLEKGAEADALREKAQQRVVASLDRERSAAEKKVEVAAGKVSEVRLEVVAKTSEVALLEADVKRLLLDAAKMRGALGVMERSREHQRAEVLELERRIKEGREELRERDVLIGEMEAKEEEAAEKVKQGQAAYDKLKVEATGVKARLEDVTKEVAELRRKYKVQVNQLIQVKDAIDQKDRAINEEAFERKSVEQRLEQKTSELTHLKRLLEQATANVAKQDSEIGELSTSITRLDAEALAQRRAYDQIVAERDILGTQLIRRNDELALLYEKMSIQASCLSAGEAQYRARLEDARMLKTKVVDLNRENTALKASAGSQAALKRELVRAQNELTLEKRRVAALSIDIEKPKHTHRWRTLHHVDPGALEMMAKIQLLQKRLIHKSEEIVEKDLALAEKDRNFGELKAMLARQPGPEIVEALSSYQSLLTERTRQLKALASETHMYKAQIDENRGEIETLTRQLVDAKRAYFELRNKERTPSAGGAGAEAKPGGGEGSLGAEALTGIRPAVGGAASGRTPVRFYGGGFAAIAFGGPP